MIASVKCMLIEAEPKTTILQKATSKVSKSPQDCMSKCPIL